MKKVFALALAMALTFSTTVCAAETVVPEKQFPELGTLTEDVEKILPEYTSNAVADMDGVDDLAVIASGSDLYIAGAETNATCVIDKVDVAAIRYAQQKAEQVGGSMLTVVALSAPGVDLTDAQVKLAVNGVAAGDAVSVYKAVKGDWVAVDVAAVADGSVTIPFESKGIYTLIK